MEFLPGAQSFQDYLSTPEDLDVEDLMEAERARAKDVAAWLKEFPKARDPRRSELVGLLCEAWEKDAVLERDRAVALHLDQRDRFWTGESLTAPVLKMDRARTAWLAKANFLRDVVNNGGSHPRLAEWMWNLGFAMVRAGNEHGNFYLDQAIQRFPQSPFALNARLAKVEWLLSRAKWSEAVAQLSEIRGAAEPRLKLWADFRLGWAYALLGMNSPEPARSEALSKAQAAFKLVVLTLAGRESEGAFPVREESLAALAWLWAIRGDEAQAVAFFEAQKVPELKAVFFEKQADEAKVSKNTERAVELYGRLAGVDALSRRRVDWQLKIARAHLESGGVKLFRDDLKNFDAFLSDAADKTWLKAHKEETEVMERARLARENLGRVAAFRLFELGREEKDPKRRAELLEGARAQFEECLKGNPSGEDLVASRYGLASILMLLEKYPEAFAAYAEILKLSDAPPADKKLTVDPAIVLEASFNRLLIMEKKDQATKYPRLPEPGRARKPIEIPTVKVEYLAAAEDYLKRAGNDVPAVPAVRYLVAFTYFSYGHYDKALGLLESLMRQYPKSPEGLTGTEYLMKYHLDRKNWDELIRIATEALNDRNVRGKDLREFLRQHLDFAKEQKANNTSP
jgi:tetratricopeptide (TPR) repeat protein